jgi:hypothetical protein
METLETSALEVGMDKYIADLAEVAASLPQVFRDYAEGDRGEQGESLKLRAKREAMSASAVFHDDVAASALEQAATRLEEAQTLEDEVLAKNIEQRTGVVVNMEEDAANKQQLQVGRDRVTAVVQAGKEFFSDETGKILSDKKTLNDHWAEFERFFQDYMTGDEHTVSMKRRLQSEVSARVSLLDRREATLRLGLDIYSGLEQTVNAAFEAATHAYENRSRAARDRLSGLAAEYYSMASDALSLCSDSIISSEATMEHWKDQASAWEYSLSVGKQTWDSARVNMSKERIATAKGKVGDFFDALRQQECRFAAVSGPDFTEIIEELKANHDIQAVDVTRCGNPPQPSSILLSPPQSSSALLNPPQPSSILLSPPHSSSCPPQSSSCRRAAMPSRSHAVAQLTRSHHSLTCVCTCTSHHSLTCVCTCTVCKGLPLYCFGLRAPFRAFTRMLLRAHMLACMLARIRAGAHAGAHTGAHAGADPFRSRISCAYVATHSFASAHFRQLAPGEARQVPNRRRTGKDQGKRGRAQCFQGRDGKPPLAKRMPSSCSGRLRAAVGAGFGRDEGRGRGRRRGGVMGGRRPWLSVCCSIFSPKRSPLSSFYFSFLIF